MKELHAEEQVKCARVTRESDHERGTILEIFFGKNALHCSHESVQEVSDRLEHDFDDEVVT